MSQSPSKRSRKGKEDALTRADYVLGSVVRVHLHNFVTYSDAEFHPGPRLNVVLGPNGSGKSTIVCALALGLCGSPKLLGRGKDVKSFIKNGCDAGWVEVELFNNKGRNWVIRRRLHGNQSTYQLNGRSSTKEACVALVRKLNIQVDNLCQFLPQDRVGEFAKMNAAERLQATQRAAGGTAMLKLHHELIEEGARLSEQRMSLEAAQTRTNELRERSAHMEDNVRRYEEHQRLRLSIEAMEKKLPWLIFLQAQEAAKALKEEVKRLRADYDKAKRACAPFERRIRGLADESDTVEQEKAKLRKQQLLHERKMQHQAKKQEAAQDRVNDLQDELNSLDVQKGRLQAAVRRSERSIKDTEANLAKLPDEVLLQGKAEELSQQKKEASRDKRDAETAKRAAQRAATTAKARCDQAQARVRDLENIRQQRLGKLQRVRDGRDVINVYKWLQQAGPRLQQPILGPLFAEVNVTLPEAAGALEQALPTWLRTAFVAQTTPDASTLKQHLSTLRDGQVDVVDRDRSGRDRGFEHPVSPQEARALGITCFMDQVFDAPPEVRFAMLNNGALHRIAYAPNATPQQRAALSERGMAFFTKDTYTVSRKSRHSKGVSVATSGVRNPKLFSAGVDEDALAQARSACLEATQAYQDANRELHEASRRHETHTSHLSALGSELASVRRRLQEPHKLRAALEGLRVRLREEQAELAAFDADAERSRITAAMVTALRGPKRACVAYAEQLSAYVDACLAADANELRGLHVRARLRAEQQRRDAELAELERALDALKARKEEFKVVKDDVRRKLETARQACDPDAEKENFERLPNDVQELQHQLHVEQAQLRMLYDDFPPDLVAQFERQRDQLIAEEATLATLEAQVAELQAGIDDRLARWLPPLEQLVAAISVSFANFMGRIHCQGEVHLTRADSFDKWGLDLMVKFREQSELVALADKRQSGGEKSVSTMLYLLALQSLTPCPFRLVDEINQGMDQRNERHVFHLVVEESCRPGPQQFLVTPKLLPDLPFTEDMTVFVVFNGPHMPHQKEWDEAIEHVGLSPKG